MEKLFYDSNNNLITTDDIRKGLRAIGADDCDVLFIHSDIMFGKPAEGFKKNTYLQTLYEIIDGLNIKSIIVPTFTYSFCNKEIYDVNCSRTYMGALNEFIRKKNGRYRTVDPILSLSVPEDYKLLFEHESDNSLGVGSGLDILHKIDGVKFLFFGAEMSECFTYVHYVEKIMDVKYRFDMPFEGDIILSDGTKIHKRQYLHTQCMGVKVPQKYDYFENEMVEKGYLRKIRIGDKYISCMSEKDSYREIERHIRDDKYYFLLEPYDDNIKKIYTYNLSDGRITHC